MAPIQDLFASPIFIDPFANFAQGITQPGDLGFTLAEGAKQTAQAAELRRLQKKAAEDAESGGLIGGTLGEILNPVLGGALSLGGGALGNAIVPGVGGAVGGILGDALGGVVQTGEVQAPSLESLAGAVSPGVFQTVVEGLTPAAEGVEAVALEGTVSTPDAVNRAFNGAAQLGQQQPTQTLPPELALSGPPAFSDQAAGAQSFSDTQLAQEQARVQAEAAAGQAGAAQQVAIDAVTPTTFEVVDQPQIPVPEAPALPAPQAPIEPGPIESPAAQAQADVDASIALAPQTTFEDAQSIFPGGVGDGTVSGEAPVGTLDFENAQSIFPTFEPGSGSPDPPRGGGGASFQDVGIASSGGSLLAQETPASSTFGDRFRAALPEGARTPAGFIQTALEQAASAPRRAPQFGPIDTGALNPENARLLIDSVGADRRASLASFSAEEAQRASATRLGISQGQLDLSRQREERLADAPTNLRTQLVPTKDRFGNTTFSQVITDPTTGQTRIEPVPGLSSAAAAPDPLTAVERSREQTAILNEILRTGTPAQRQAANEMLDQVETGGLSGRVEEAEAISRARAGVAQEFEAGPKSFEGLLTQQIIAQSEAEGLSPDLIIERVMDVESARAASRNQAERKWSIVDSGDGLKFYSPSGDPTSEEKIFVGRDNAQVRNISDRLTMTLLQRLGYGGIDKDAQTGAFAMLFNPDIPFEQKVVINEGINITVNQMMENHLETGDTGTPITMLHTQLNPDGSIASVSRILGIDLRGEALPVDMKPGTERVDTFILPDPKNLVKPDKPKRPTAVTGR